MMPQDLPAWAAVYPQTQRWIRSGVVEALVDDVRMILRLAHERNQQPSAAMFDRRTLQSSPERGHRAGDDGANRRKGSNVHLAVDPLGYLLSLHVTPANEQDRDQVETLAAAVQEVTGHHIEIAFVDQGDTGSNPAQTAKAHGMRLEVVRLPEAKRGFVLLPRRWVVERSFAWMTRFRRLARDDERWPETLAGLHALACVVLMLHRFTWIMAHRP
jgi:transposase